MRFDTFTWRDILVVALILLVVYLGKQEVDGCNRVNQDLIRVDLNPKRIVFCNITFDCYTIIEMRSYLF